MTSQLEVARRVFTGKGLRIGSATGFLAAATDFVNGLAGRSSENGIWGTVYFSALIVVFCAALGLFYDLWLTVARRIASRANSVWILPTTASLPLLAFVLWVPWSWLEEHWSELGGVKKMIAVAALLLLAAAVVLASRLACRVAASYMSRGQFSRLYWVLLATCVAFTAAAYAGDRTILVGLYEDFHWGLAGFALIGTALVVILSRAALASMVSRQTVIMQLLPRLAVAFVIAMTVTLVAGETLDAPIAAGNRSVYYSKMIQVARRITDFDGDGLSNMFGGTDCKSLDATVSSGNFDIPENGVDEDCSDRDSRWPTFKPNAKPRHITPDRQGYNLVLISVDALRADHVGAYGYDRKTTPNIDRIAASGLLFRRAFTQSIITFFSIPSMMSGRYLSNIFKDYGHSALKGSKMIFHINPKTKLLAEMLAQQGYQTGGFASIRRLKWQGVNRGFKTYRLKLKTVAHASKFVQKAKEPFFAWMHPSEPHNPYKKHKKFDFGETDLDRYDSEIAYVDAQLKRLFKVLKKRGVFDRTIIVITADHGEEFGEHGGKFHASRFFDELTNVPLIIKVPGVAPAVFESPVELIDLVPTLLDLLRVPRPSTWLDGQNLFARLDSPNDQGDAAAYSEHYNAPQKRWKIALRTSEWKLIRNLKRDSSALYNVTADPKEQTNVAAANPARVFDLKERAKTHPLANQGRFFKNAKTVEGLQQLAEGLDQLQREPLLLFALSLLKGADQRAIAPHLRRLAKRPGLPKSVMRELGTFEY